MDPLCCAHGAAFIFIAIITLLIKINGFAITRPKIYVSFMY